MTHYLVKWCSLSYEEATWELQEDLDPEKIKEFEEVQTLPTELRHMVSRIIIDSVKKRKIVQFYAIFDMNQKNVKFCIK